jgi:hypothetical protein
MLAPRFSIRALLAVLTGAALFFLISGLAVRGDKWAWGITIGVLSLLLAAGASAAWFWFVWLFAQLPVARAAAQAELASEKKKLEKIERPSPPDVGSANNGLSSPKGH